MQSLTPGANAPLGALASRIQFETGTIPGAEIDVSAFLIGQDGKVRGDGDMCFYGQPRVADGAVEFLPESGRAGQSVFSFDLHRLPRGVEKIIFAATIYENRASFGRIPGITVSCETGLSGQIPCTGMTETALMLAELYQRNGQWKLRMLGQGFNGGLPALATHLGVDVAGAPSSPAPAVKPAPVPAPAAPTVSLSKVSLTKEKATVSLKKPDGRFGTIRCNLNWQQRPPARGIMGGLFGSQQVDLDLGALVEDRYGNKFCVQALGNSFGDFTYAPYVRLKGDDRTGAVADGEWLEINGQQWPEFNRILLFAFIYDGVPDWRQTDGVVRLFIPDQPEIEVRMNEFGSQDGMCAVALLENHGGQIKVKREVKFFSSHSYMDAHYGWGMNWVAGRK
ncbi:TerD family protein [Leisingera sp. XS_AS12]|uniref:TerD family protein n=1 Tax=Leisingera sp. XS_AS12 TaxID=3241294 RepID=UPI003514585E